MRENDSGGRGASVNCDVPPACVCVYVLRVCVCLCVSPLPSPLQRDGFQVRLAPFRLPAPPVSPSRSSHRKSVPPPNLSPTSIVPLPDDRTKSNPLSHVPVFLIKARTLLRWLQLASLDGPRSGSSLGATSLVCRRGTSSRVSMPTYIQGPDRSWATKEQVRKSRYGLLASGVGSQDAQEAQRVSELGHVIGTS